LADQVYWMEWYEQQPKIRKDLRFVLARCQKPLGLVGPPSMGFAGYSLFLIVSNRSNIIIIEYVVLWLICEISDVENLLFLSDSTERGHIVKSVLTKRPLFVN